MEIRQKRFHKISVIKLQLLDLRQYSMILIQFLINLLCAYDMYVYIELSVSMSYVYSWSFIVITMLFFRLKVGLDSIKYM